MRHYTVHMVNDFHGTQATLIISQDNGYRVSRRQYNAALAACCGVKDCLCGDHVRIVDAATHEREYALQWQCEDYAILIS